MNLESWHRHFGVYGICCHVDRLLVVNKTAGPYMNRYDLPGGTMEPNETVQQALSREFKEETGMQLMECRQLGFCEFIVRYSQRDHSHIQHIPLFFQVKCNENCNEHQDLRLSNDSSGCEWVSLQDINEANASPLVIKAKDILVNKEFTYESKKFDEWKTIENIF